MNLLISDKSCAFTSVHICTHGHIQVHCTSLHVCMISTSTSVY